MSYLRTFRKTLEKWWGHGAKMTLDRFTQVCWCDKCKEARRVKEEADVKEDRPKVPEEERNEDRSEGNGVGTLYAEYNEEGEGSSESLRDKGEGATQDRKEE